MLFEAVVLALITGIIFKGRPANLKTFEIKHAWLIFGGLIVRYVPKLLELKFMGFIPVEIEEIAPLFFAVSYMMLIAGCAFNLDQWEMIVVLSGVVLNFAVVIANGGYMPVSREILEASGYPLNELKNARIDMNHILTGDDTRLRFLADNIPLTRLYPMKKIISLGDILMSAGVFMLIFRRLRGRSSHLRNINNEEGA